MPAESVTKPEPVFDDSFVPMEAIANKMPIPCTRPLCHSRKPAVTALLPVIHAIPSPALTLHSELSSLYLGHIVPSTPALFSLRHSGTWTRCAFLSSRGYGCMAPPVYDPTLSHTLLSPCPALSDAAIATQER